MPARDMSQKLICSMLKKIFCMHYAIYAQLTTYALTFLVDEYGRQEFSDTCNATSPCLVNDQL